MKRSISKSGLRKDLDKLFAGSSEEIYIRFKEDPLLRGILKIHDGFPSLLVGLVTFGATSMGWLIAIQNLDLLFPGVVVSAVLSSTGMGSVAVILAEKRMAAKIAPHVAAWSKSGGSKASYNKDEVRHLAKVITARMLFVLPPAMDDELFSELMQKHRLK